MAASEWERTKELRCFEQTIFAGSQVQKWVYVLGGIAVTLLCRSLVRPHTREMESEKTTEKDPPCEGSQTISQ